MASRLVYSILFYGLSMLLLIVSKPDVLFDKDGTPKRFGFGPGKTLFSLGVLTVALAVLSFYTFALIDLIFQ
jgi:hypothetical protein